MTTPAVNINKVDTLPHIVRVELWNQNGSFDPYDLDRGPIPHAWFSESRPESGSSPVDKRLGWRPCRPWNHSSARWISSAGTVVDSVSYGSYGARYVHKNGGFWGVEPPAVPPVPGGLVNRAEQEALNRLKDQQIHVGNFVAEFHQVVRMVGNHANTIAKQVRRFRRTNPKKVWNAVVKYEAGNGRYNPWRKHIPSAWLELQYGWKPLLSDVQGALYELSRTARTPLVSVKGYEEDYDELEVRLENGPCSAVLTYNVKHQCWVRLYYNLVDGTLAELSTLGLINPLEIVWECLPYSFVVDWFVPVGSWLSSLTAAVGYRFVGGNRSTKTVIASKGVKEVIMPRSSAWGGSSFSGDAPRLDGEASSFNRFCYDHSPVPGLYVKSPMSALHAANAIALLAQAFR